MAQIGCWMTAGQAEQLGSYAAALDLSRPAVLALLVHRELRESRLDHLRRHRALYPNDKTATRVTIRITDTARKNAYAAHVKGQRIGSDEAAWLLFTEELEEQWIREKLAWTGRTIPAESL